MDFAIRYTDEQQAFRREVRGWLDQELAGWFDGWPADAAALTEEQFERARTFKRRLGAKGWWAPTWPAEYGGGGLSVDQEMVIEEELRAREIGPAFLGDVGVYLCAPAIRAWGTEEQKRRFLPAILRGEHIIWQVFTEPEAGSDLASLKTRAVQDGDDYVLNGNKIFVGAKWGSEYLYTLAVTDPEAPRHQNISAFMIPTDSPGVTSSRLDLIAGGGKRMIYLEDVRVPRANLIGGEAGRGKGWAVATTTLELEHGGAGGIARDPLVDRFIDYCRTAWRNGRPISADPRVQQLLAEVHIHSHTGQLFGTRNYWLRTSGRRATYEGSQFALWGKTFQPWLAGRIRDVLGPYASINDPAYGALTDAIEHQQRESLATHPGGTPEIQKVVMARAIGVSRTQRPSGH